MVIKAAEQRKEGHEFQSDRVDSPLTSFSFVCLLLLKHYRKHQAEVRPLKLIEMSFLIRGQFGGVPGSSSQRIFLKCENRTLQDLHIWVKPNAEEPRAWNGLYTESTVYKGLRSCSADRSEKVDWQLRKTNKVDYL